MIGDRLGWIRYLGCALALATLTSARAAETVDALLARGACSAAITLVRSAVKDADHDPTPLLADALAEASRVALDCAGADSAELDDWLAREVALRTQFGIVDDPAVGFVKLKQARRDLQRNNSAAALESLRALDAHASAAKWPADLRARIADQLSAVHNARAEGQLAFAAAGRAIALARSARDRATLVQALGNRAFALVSMRRATEALPLLAEAESNAREHFGTDSLDRAEILRRTAQAQRELGDFGSAIGNLEQSLAILLAQVEPVQRRVTNVLLTLGQTLKMSGDSEHALTRYEEALAADAKAADPNSRLRPVILHALANLYRDSGQNERSIGLYTQAVAAFDTVYGTQSAQMAQLLNNYANAEANLERYDDAIAKYTRSLAITEALQSGDPADALARSNIGMIEVWRGQHAAAEINFRATIARIRDVAPGSESSALFAQIGLAASLWGQGKLDDAFSAAETAELIRQSALRLAASRLGERHAIGYQEYLRPSLDFVIAIAAASGKREHIERAWELSIAARDQVTAVTITRLAAARSGSDPAISASWREWREANGALAQSGGDAHKHKLLRDRLDRAERAIADGAHAPSAPTTARSLDVATMRSRMPAATALVLFATAQPREPGDFAKGGTDARSATLLAFVLPSATASVHLVKLGPLDEVTRVSEAWTTALADPTVALASVALRGAAVRERVWDPLARFITNKQVMMLPTGTLYRLPWSALPDDGRFLADADYRFHVLNHERDLGRPRKPDVMHLLAVADPAMATPASALASASTQRCSQSTAALPGARREVAALASLWRERTRDADTITILEGAAASESRVRVAAQKAELLHFATHGASLGDDCSPVGAPPATTRGFALASEGPLGPAANDFGATALLLAAGAASAAGNGNDDGILAAEEIASLDLSRVQWAVLAACATAAGNTRHYEGQFGLARAFRIAGARTVLTSLWPVDDDATSQWTRALYIARLIDRLDTPAALAAAQRSVLAARRARGDSIHPYYWAAFVASGDWH